MIDIFFANESYRVILKHGIVQEVNSDKMKYLQVLTRTLLLKQRDTFVFSAVNWIDTNDNRVGIPAVRNFGHVITRHFQQGRLLV